MAVRSAARNRDVRDISHEQLGYLVGLGYWIGPGRAGELGSSLSDHFGRLLLARCLLGCLTVLTRRQMSKDAELLVLRHENAVLRRQISRVRYQPADRLWLAALSQLISDAVPLGNRIRLVACRSSAPQAACVYSLIRPLRTGFRRICLVSMSVAVERGTSRSSSGMC
jgi:hypothetical protein